MVPPFTSNFKRVLSVHLMNNAWVDNSNSCFQRSITHEWASGISSPMFFIHTHQIPCSFKEILNWTLWDIIGCKKGSNTLLFFFFLVRVLPNTGFCRLDALTEKKTSQHFYFRHELNEHKLLRSWKGLYISFILNPNHFKSGGLSDKHFALGLGMTDIY